MKYFGLFLALLLSIGLGFFGGQWYNAANTEYTTIEVVTLDASKAPLYTGFTTMYCSENSAQCVFFQIETGRCWYTSAEDDGTWQADTDCTVRGWPIRVKDGKEQ